MRYCLHALILAALPLVSGSAHAVCLPTLGTDDCFRAGNPWVQAIEHHYLDDTWHQVRSRSKRHSETKGLNISPRSPSNAS
jgi:hypothetical protein